MAAQYTPKQTSKTQFQRWLFIHERISMGKYPNCQQMAKEYGVSPKTIQRDIDYMKNMLEMPIEYDGSKKGFYYTKKVPFPALPIGATDLFTFFLTDLLLSQYEGTPIYETLNESLEKIKRALDYDRKSQFNDLQRKFTIVPPPRVKMDPKIWDMIVSCLRDEKVLKISYKAPAREMTEREVDPYHMVYDQGSWYLIGWCHLREGVRIFNVGRIKSACETDKKCKSSAKYQIDFNKIGANAFGIYWEEPQERVVLNFSSVVAEYIEERHWWYGEEASLSPKIEQLPASGIKFTIKVDRLEDIIPWILSWGEHVEVLEPKELRGKIASIAGRIAKNNNKLL